MISGEEARRKFEKMRNYLEKERLTKKEGAWRDADPAGGYLYEEKPFEFNSDSGQEYKCVTNLTLYVFKEGQEAARYIEYGLK